MASFRLLLLWLWPLVSFAFTIGMTRPTRSRSASRTIYASLLPDSVINSIQTGGIAQVDGFLSTSQVRTLRTDAQNLFLEGHFITDAIAGYGNNNDKTHFDIRKDRSVCPAYIPSKNLSGPFVNDELGDGASRKQLTRTIAQLRSDLALKLDRPGMASLPDGMYNHELSYTRFGPGAYLKRHTDEHHEELKGKAGWAKPTRRSLSWLVYLNEPDWDSSKDGGCLRTYPQLNPSHTPVGSRQGDLQIGWLLPTRMDPVQRPVFLDGRRQGESGNCALYMDGIQDSSQKVYLTANFRADPYLFLSTDWAIQHILIKNWELGDRFRYVEPPKSKLTELVSSQGAANNHKGIEGVLDISPTGGTLVLFDSVALPHEVLATLERDRWAISGWFHEAQQEIPQKARVA